MLQIHFYDNLCLTKFCKIQRDVTVQKQAVPIATSSFGHLRISWQDQPLSPVWTYACAAKTKLAPGLLTLFVNSVELRVLAFHVLGIYYLFDNLLEKLVQYKVI